MSSRLHRGGNVSTEPIAWPSSGSRDAFLTLPQHASAKREPDNHAARAEEEAEQRTLDAYQQGLKDGHTAAAQEMAAKVDVIYSGDAQAWKCTENSLRWIRSGCVGWRRRMATSASRIARSSSSSVVISVMRMSG